MNYYYFDQTNQKRGPVNEQQLKELATQGVIGLHTPMETDTGHKGVAGQIPGLFPAASSASAQATPPPSNRFCTNCGSPVTEHAIGCMACGLKPTGHKKFCRQCGAGINSDQIICTKCGAKIAAGYPDAKQIIQSVTSVASSVNMAQIQKWIKPVIIAGIIAIAGVFCLTYSGCTDKDRAVVKRDLRDLHDYEKNLTILTIFTFLTLILFLLMPWKSILMP